MSTTHILSPEARDRAQRHYEAFLAEHNGEPSSLRQVRYVRSLATAGDMDGVAFILQNKLINVPFDIAQQCPADKVDTLVRLLLEFHADNVTMPGELLYKMPPSAFKIMLDSGADLRKILEDVAYRNDEPKLTDILGTAWNMRLVTEELLSRVKTCWAEGRRCPDQPPAIILTRQRALARMNWIRSRPDVPFQNARFDLEKNVAQRGPILADAFLESAIVAKNLLEIHTSLLRGAALDGETPEHAPIRLAAELKDADVFARMLWYVEHPTVENLPNVARAAALRGGPDIIKLLVAKVGTPDFDDGALLYYALKSWSRTTVESVLALGANPLAGSGRAWHLCQEIDDPSITRLIETAARNCAEVAAPLWAVTAPTLLRRPHFRG